MRKAGNRKLLEYWKRYDMYDADCTTNYPSRTPSNDVKLYSYLNTM